MSDKPQPIRLEDAIAEIEALSDGSLVIHKCGGMIMEIELHLRKKQKDYGIRV